MALNLSCGKDHCVFPPQEVKGEAKIPEGVKFGVMCDVAGKLLIGDWKIQGVVLAVDHDTGIIMFKTNPVYVRDKLRQESQPGRLAYRLPHDLTLSLAAGDPITVMHDHEMNSKRVEWDIHLSSGKKLILATSHGHDDTPPQSAEQAEVLFEGAPGGHSVFYWSNPEDNEPEQNLKAKARVDTRVSLKARDDGEHQTIEFDNNRMLPIELDDEKYVFVVLASELYSNEESAAHDAQASHTLECLLVKSAQ